MSSDEESSFEIQSDDEEEDYYNMSLIEGEIARVEVVDFEDFEFECLSIEKVENLLNESADALGRRINVASPIAKIILRNRKWAVEDDIDVDNLLIDSLIKPSSSKINSTTDECAVCFESDTGHEFRRLQCGHSFCISCWLTHFEMQLSQGVSTEMECMDTNCKIIVPEDFAVDVLSKSNFIDKYNKFALRDCVTSHPELRFCPGPNCSVVIRAKQAKSKRVTCDECKSVFCFNCGSDYHAPTDCATIKKWLAKCEMDSGNATYLRNHTKDCPKCVFVIEKNGGCNHMSCTRCKYEFCWLCLRDWKEHTTGSYRCSIYEENKTKLVESAHVERVTMQKYLFYFDRWANHAESLRLEHLAVERVKRRTEQKTKNQQGTWIDWQYLFDAAALLAKCRYTLKYTYALVYFMECGDVKKELFEYQQAQLESAIEMLAWKIENVDVTGRGDLVNQMAVCAGKRTTLLVDFGNYENGTEN